MRKRIPYTPPKCTVCGKQALAFAKNKEPRCIRHQRDPPQTKPCKCGGAMRIRENKKNHSYFWGCENFPKCLETESV